MSNTIQSGNTQFVNFEQLNNTAQVDIKSLGVGAGLAAKEKNAPPAPSQESVGKLTASLSIFMSAGASGMDVEVLLVQVAVAMRDTEATSQKAKINTDQEAKKAQMQEKEKKLEEAQKKLEEAEEKRKSGSLLDKIKLAFEWIGAIIAVAVAAVMIATGVGAVVGGLLLAAAVTAIVMAIDSTVTAATGHGIAGNIAKAAGASPEEIAKADMGFKISMAVLGIALSLAAGGANVVGAAKSAISAGKAAADMGMAAKEVALAAKTAFMAALKESGNALSMGARMTQRVATISEVVIGGGTAAMEGAKAGIKYEETNLRAEAKQFEAQSKVDEAVMQMLDDLIDQALTRLMAAGDRFNTILDDIMAAVNERGQTLGKARFAG